MAFYNPRCIDAPRARLWDGRLVHLEDRIADAEVTRLRTMGHNIQPVDSHTRVVGGVHAISREPDTGAFLGAADARRDGCAVAP